MNRMKNTRCIICDADLNNMTYDKMMAHVYRHADEKKTAEAEARTQTGLDDF